MNAHFTLSIGDRTFEKSTRIDFLPPKGMGMIAANYCATSVVSTAYWIDSAEGLDIILELRGKELSEDILQLYYRSLLKDGWRKYCTD